MSATTRNCCQDIDSDSFIVCFYCNESFSSLSSLLEHCCSAEEKISLDCEPLETFSDISSDDLEQEDSVDNKEAAFENQFDLPRLVIVEAESTTNSACEASLSGADTACEKSLSVTHSNAPRQEIIEIASDILKNKLSEINSDGVRELTFNVSEKRLLESNSDVVSEKISKLTFDTPKEILITENSDAIITENSDAKQKITEVASNIANDINKPSADLVSKVLQNYEIKKSTLNVCDKSPSTEEKFQSFYLPLPEVESGSSKHDTIGLECPASTMISRSSSSKMESDASNTFSRSSSSLEMDFDSMAYDDNQTDSDYSVTNDMISSPEKSNVLKHDYKQVRSYASEISDKSLLEENLNITNYDSVIVKPCYVKVQDIFKSLSNTKVSPQKIFSWKKKYHVCDVCYKFFRLRSDLNIHYLLHSVVKPYVCNICEKSFVKEGSLLAHRHTHIMEKKHICSVCKKAFLKKSILLRHELTHTKEKPFSCEICGKSYQVKSSLSEHYLSHSNEKPYVCEICSASFRNKRYLRRHYYTHQNSERTCRFCNKIFKRKHHLEDHYNVHTNDKPYECKFCSKTFHLLLGLNRHYSKVHRIKKAFISPENVETFSSPESDKSFADNSVGKIPVIQIIEKLEVVDECENTPVVQKIEKLDVVDKCEKTPVVQKIEKLDVVDKCGKTPVVQKIQKLDVVDKCEKTPVIQKIEKPSIIHTNKDTPIYNTRRKKCIPKKYLQ